MDTSTDYLQYLAFRNMTFTPEEICIQEFLIDIMLLTIYIRKTYMTIKHKTNYHMNKFYNRHTKHNTFFKTFLLEILIKQKFISVIQDITINAQFSSTLSPPSSKINPQTSMSTGNSDFVCVSQ